MKTVGEILKSARAEQNISLDEAESVTKIRKKYLQALEENEWQKLPSLTYTKGFIKNYAQFLGLNFDLVMAFFRRQSAEVERVKVMPRGMSEPLNEPFLRLTPSKILGGFVLILIFLFFFWLFGQYQSFVGTPKILIDRPGENEIVRGTFIDVSGQTDPWVTLTINGQEVKLINGKFNQEIAATPGTIKISVIATNKFGRKQEVTRTVRVETP